MEFLPSMVRDPRLRRLLRRHAWDLALAFTCLVISAALFPSVALADLDPHEEARAKAVAIRIKAMQNELAPFGRLPEPPAPAWKWRVKVPITAYSSEPWQTDDTPFITASGSHVRDGIVAANFLPIGTKVRIPNLFGDKEFVVEDRMNARYHERMDIWMEVTADARTFGIKNALVEVY